MMQVTEYLRLGAKQPPRTMIKSLRYHRDEHDSTTHRLLYAPDWGQGIKAEETDKVRTLVQSGCNRPSTHLPTQFN